MYNGLSFLGHLAVDRGLLYLVEPCSKSNVYSRSKVIYGSEVADHQNDQNTSVTAHRHTQSITLPVPLSGRQKVLSKPIDAENRKILMENAVFAIRGSCAFRDPNNGWFTTHFSETTFVSAMLHC